MNLFWTLISNHQPSHVSSQQAHEVAAVVLLRDSPCGHPSSAILPVMIEVFVPAKVDFWFKCLCAELFEAAEQNKNCCNKLKTKKVEFESTGCETQWRTTAAAIRTNRLLNH